MFASCLRLYRGLTNEYTEQTLRLASRLTKANEPWCCDISKSTRFLEFYPKIVPLTESTLVILTTVNIQEEHKRIWVSRWRNVASVQHQTSPETRENTYKNTLASLKATSGMYSSPQGNRQRAETATCEMKRHTKRHKHKNMKPSLKLWEHRC